LEYLTEERVRYICSIDKRIFYQLAIKKICGVFMPLKPEAFMMIAVLGLSETGNNSRKKKSFVIICASLFSATSFSCHCCSSLQGD